jgi:glycosyltransferase involved in cell wall biosynthesis
MTTPPLPEAAFFISKELQKDYIEAAKFIDNSDIDICILQHEYGIFGGDSGTFILSLVRQLKIPLIVTFHTVLKNPSSVQKLILHELGKKAEKIVVMSHKAIDFLTTIYQLPSEKIKLIEHGVPSLKRIQNSRYKNCRIDRNLKGKKILFTFGLLSRNKGIETVIRALPKLVLKHPSLKTRFIFKGCTPISCGSWGKTIWAFLSTILKLGDVLIAWKVTV